MSHGHNSLKGVTQGLRRVLIKGLLGFASADIDIDRADRAGC